MDMIPCGNMPDGVLSMFSVAETNATPAAWRARWIDMSSARFRARRSTLWTMR
ncbi:MAG TPA: hypothetical protein VKV38_13195 [Trebonia sp.]|nr:hypothetical protein [Trebonia sp.]